jgi:DNA-binding transcriptional MerR regulator
LRIGEIAATVHLPPKTIRYYEEVGVLPPARRSSAGYRLYSPRDVERLNFVRRAKLLGLSLRQIKDLVGYAVDGRCEHLQQHLLDLMDTKCAEIDRQVAELLALKDDLRRLGAEISERLCSGQGAAGADRTCSCLNASQEPICGGTS